MTPISVTTLNNQIKSLLEATFVQISVVGEVGRVTHHSSGHIYFAIKDDGATVDCVMFRGNAARLRFRLEQGMRVIVHGAVTLYAPQGRYQINCATIEPDGAGALAVAFEQLKKRLSDLGWFDPSHKKPLPPYPKSIALVTSATGAALEDMLKVANRRWQLTKLICVNTLVQGEMAPKSIIRSIRYADGLGVDIIVVSRGGGSMEDLWCFNDENVARAIFEAKTPIVSAVGHEIDFVISDFVADLRASTPTAAMEMILPDMQSEMIRSDELKTHITRAFLGVISQKISTLNHLKASFAQFSMEARFRRDLSQITQLKSQLDQTYKFIISKHASDLEHLRKQLDLLSPANRLSDKTAQVVKDGKLCTLIDLIPTDRIVLLDGKVKANATVDSVEMVGI